MDRVTLDEDTMYDDILVTMATCDNTLFNLNKQETLHMINCEHQVAHPCQLGDWMTIRVDALTQ